MTAVVWQDNAACANMNPDLFFPKQGRDTSRPQAVCHACPVRLACLDHALSTPERFGIWGGLSERQRRAIRIRRRKAVAA